MEPSINKTLYENLKLYEDNHEGFTFIDEDKILNDSSNYLIKSLDILTDKLLVSLRAKNKFYFSTFANTKLDNYYLTPYSSQILPADEKFSLKSLEYLDKVFDTYRIEILSYFAGFKD